MKNSTTSQKVQSEVSDFNTQYRLVYQALYRKPKTMKMVEVETGVDRAYICWHVKKMREENKIAVVEYRLCAITKYRAGYLTTDPERFPVSSQLELF